jgi:hypothetical protein
MDAKREALHPDRRSKLRRAWIGGVLFVLVASLGFAGCRTSTTVNGQVTTSSTIDLLKLIGGPVLAGIGAGLLNESRQYANGAATRLGATGAAFAAAGVGLLIWGVTLL